tara:strand:- start:5381 stop:6895 length:1515 start_codon:yes stop_codon:yes gene_type:complete
MLYYEKSKIADKDNPVNITYGELLQKSDSNVEKWIDELRDWVIDQWDNHGQPPVIGKNTDDIISNWKKLKDLDVNTFFTNDNKVIRNFNKSATSVNQFFPTMLKTKISTGVSSENCTSIYDMFKEDSLRDHFKKAMLRSLYKDSMYSFGKTILVKDIKGDINQHITGINNSDEYGITIVKQKQPKPISKDSELLTFNGTQVKELLENGTLTQQNVRTIKDGFDDEFVLKNGQTRYWYYFVRRYNKNQRIFPTALQIFRLGLGQPAVNFPPLTAKFLYQHFTKHINSEVVNVYDPSSGWGGRILGAMSTNRKLHYIGTDPNPDTSGRYQGVADFYNDNCVESNSFWGDEKNTYEVFQDGSEVIGNNPDFQKYKGNLDMVFTSPPYFNREQYSQDENQSFKKFDAYDDWRDHFLKPTLTTAFTYLKPDRYLLWNIADIKVGGDKYIPLEQDSIDVVESLGGEYQGIYKMLMTRMVGIDASQVKNSVEIDGTYYKYEPILIFYKGKQ